MLRILLFTKHLARNAVRLPGVFPDKTIELHVGYIQLRLAVGNILVDHLDELDTLLAIELAAVLVHALQIHFRRSGWLVVPALQAPNVKPVRGTGAVNAKQVQADRDPLVYVLLNDLQGDDAGLDDALDAVLSRAQGERLFLE